MCQAHELTLGNKITGQTLINELKIRTYDIVFLKTCFLQTKIACKTSAITEIYPFRYSTLIIRITAFSLPMKFRETTLMFTSHSEQPKILQLPHYLASVINN